MSEREAKEYDNRDNGKIMVIFDRDYTSDLVRIDLKT